LADPFAHGNDYPGQELQPHQRAIVDKARELLKNL
jgi:hypothetical protein